jgi:UDP-N-acetylglucosamine 2-epimerase (non-hydrolysing)
MAAALAAFYRRLPLVHVEAGLRTGNLQAPWPEEMNRRVASIVTTLHCAPTQGAADNLLAEGVLPVSIRVTGNTVIDALMWAVERERAADERWRKKYDMLAQRRMVLITGHRRENFGAGFESICRAIATLAGRYADVAFVYPVHLNPNVQEPVRRILGSHKNVYLTAPAPYNEFVWLMDRSTVILTDSGGVQEEAPSLRKPIRARRSSAG